MASLPPDDMTFDLSTVAAMLNETETLTTAATKAPYTGPFTYSFMECFWGRPETAIDRWLYVNQYFITLPLNFIGTVMTLIVYGAKMMRGTPYFYMCLLGIFDFSFLFLQMIAYRLKFWHRHHSWGDFGCSFMEYSWLVMYSIAIFTLICMTVERLLVIAFPFKFQHFFTVKKSMLILGVGAVLICAAYFPVLWGYGVADNPVTTFSDQRSGLYQCRFYPYGTQEHEYVIAATYIRFFVFALGAMVILMISNVGIIIVLAIGLKKKSEMAGADAGEKATSQMRHITIQMLTISIAYVVLCLPAVIFFPPGGYFQTGNWVFCSQAWLMRSLVRGIVQFLQNLQHSMNAYLYCLVSPRFRNELLIKLHLRTKGPKEGRTASTGLSTSAASASQVEKK